MNCSASATVGGPKWVVGCGSVIAVWAFMRAPERISTRMNIVMRMNSRTALRMGWQPPGEHCIWRGSRCSPLVVRDSLLAFGFPRFPAVIPSERPWVWARVEGSAVSWSSKLLRRDAIRPNVWSQHFRNQHAAIRLLVVLNNRHPCAPDCESAAVERVHQFRLLAAFRAIADVRPSRLEVRKVRAGRDLAKQSLSRQPDLDVVGLGRRETQVCGTQCNRAVVQPQPLQHLLGIARELLVFFPRLLWLGELHELDFLKLVLANDASHILAVRTGLAAEARRVRGERNRQARAVERFVAVKIGHRNFGGRNKVQVLLAMRNFE